MKKIKVLPVIDKAFDNSFNFHVPTPNSRMCQPPSSHAQGPSLLSIYLLKKTVFVLLLLLLGFAQLFLGFTPVLCSEISPWDLGGLYSVPGIRLGWLCFAHTSTSQVGTSPWLDYFCLCHSLRGFSHSQMVKGEVGIRRRRFHLT